MKMLGFLFQSKVVKLSSRRAGLRFCQSPLMSLSIWATSKDSVRKLEKKQLGDVMFGVEFVWVQQKFPTFSCLLFIFVGSLVTVKLKNLDFQLNHQKIYVFF